MRTILAQPADIHSRVALPGALSETSCIPGCARHANAFTWTLVSLASGASAKFATVKAGAVRKVLAAAASQNPDATR